MELRRWGAAGAVVLFLLGGVACEGRADERAGQEVDEEVDLEDEGGEGEGEGGD